MYYRSVTVILMTSLICSTVMARPQDDNKIMEKIVMDCMVKEGASEVDLGELISFNLPSRRTGQCLNACMMESIGMVRKYINFNWFCYMQRLQLNIIQLSDCVISVENSLAAASRRNGNNAQKMKIHAEVLEVCSKVSSSTDRYARYRIVF